jgi:hypothetical protein
LASLAITIDNYDNDFNDFLKLAVKDFIEKKDARGYFRSAEIGIISEDEGESDVSKIK